MGFAPTWLRQVSPPPLLHKTTLTTGLKCCWVQALQDHKTVINVIDEVDAETEKSSEVAGMKRGTAW